MDHLSRIHHCHWRRCIRASQYRTHLVGGGPASLSMFQGKYGLNPQLFWMLIHPVNLVLFILTLAVHRRSDRRKTILIVFSSYALILVITFIYFVPELLSITKTAFLDTVDADLTRRAQLWEQLSIARLIMLTALSIILLLGLTKKGTRYIIGRVTT